MRISPSSQDDRDERTPERGGTAAVKDRKATAVGKARLPATVAGVMAPNPNLIAKGVIAMFSFLNH